MNSEEKSKTFEQILDDCLDKTSKNPSSDSGNFSTETWVRADLCQNKFHFRRPSAYPVRKKKLTSKPYLPQPQLILNEAHLNADQVCAIETLRRYDNLGLKGPSIHFQQVKKTYRSLVKKFHPDMGLSEDSQVFLSLVTAYETLQQAFQLIALANPEACDNESAEE